jgi:hypothetical protein
VCVVCVCVRACVRHFLCLCLRLGCVLLRLRAVASVYVGGIRIGIGMSSVELKVSYTSSLRPHTLAA